MKYKISSIASIISGGTPQKNVPEYWGGTIPWITIKDFNSKYVSSVTNYISKDGFNNSSVNLTKNNDILISARGTVGKLLMVKQGMTFNQSIYCIRPNKQLVIPDYLYYWLCKNIERIKKGVHGSVFDTITRKTFDLIEINLPSLQLQKEKLKKVKALDDKIELNQRVNANLQKLASTYFQFFLKKIETTNVLLEEVANIKSGGDKPKDITSKKDSDHLIPIFSNGMTNEGLYGYTKIAKIKEKAITVSARGTIGYTCLRTEPYFPIVRLISVIPYPKISVYYLYLWLLNTDIQGFGTTQQQLTVPVFKKYSVSIPKDLKDMSFFDNHVSVFFEQIQKNKEETKLLKEIKESLLKKLF